MKGVSTWAARRLSWGLVAAALITTGDPSHAEQAEPIEDFQELLSLAGIEPPDFETFANWDGDWTDRRQRLAARIVFRLRQEAADRLAAWSDEFPGSGATLTGRKLQKGRLYRLDCS
ncbi:MAG: hypothetical protein AAF961_01825, partial [Planctomycetota bacterium]